MAGLAITLSIVIIVAEAFDLNGSPAHPSRVSGGVRIFVALVLFTLSVKQSRRRPRAGVEAQVPKWLASVDSLTPATSAGLGFLLAAVNPTALLITVAAGALLAKSPLSGVEFARATTVFVLVATTTIVVPLAAYLLVPHKLDGPLATGKLWLIEHNAAITTIILIAIGALVLHHGLESFY